MKKFLSLITMAAMMTSLLMFNASAVTSGTSSSPDSGKVLNAAYGSAEIDGKLDDAYLKGDKITAWVQSPADEAKKKEVKTDFYSYLMYDDEKIYVFAEVFDSTPVTPANVTKRNHTTDCIEFFFWLHDLEDAEDVKVHLDIVDKGSGYFRVHTKEVCPEDDLLPNHYQASSAIAMAIVNEEIRTKVHREMTPTGYLIEFSMTIDESVKADVAAGKKIGFGIQCNDDTDDNNTRDALLWSSNNLGDKTKCGPFLLLGKDSPASTPAPQTTQAPAVTAAPVTTASPAVTTKAPVSTPATADVSPVCLLVAAAAAVTVVLVRRRTHS